MDVAFGDEPIELPEQDELGRKQFASELARTLVALPPDLTFVVGVYGLWGSGKTSILNLCKYFLAQADPTAVVLNYSPWSIATESNIVQQFLRLLNNELATQKDKALRAVGKVLEEYVGVLEIVSPEPTVAFAGKAAKGMGRVLRKRHDLTLTSVSDLKARLIKTFAGQQSRIYVVIDDIDRLSRNEAASLFQLVKGVANLPNVTYVLSFDRRFIGEQLAAEYADNGHEFVDKIVQIPLNIPEPERSVLESVLLRHAKVALKCGADIFDTEYFRKIQDTGILRRFTTIRDIKRFSNLLQFRSRVVGTDVDPVDLLVLTAIQYFDDSVFSELAQMGSLLAPNAYAAYLLPDDDGDTRERIDTALQSINRSNDILNVLFVVFPFMRIRYLRSKQNPQEPLHSRNETLRAFRSEAFARYFTLALMGNDIAETEVAELIQSLGDESIALERFRRLIRRNIAETFVKIGQRAGDIDAQTLRQLTIFLLRNGDEIIVLNKAGGGISSDVLSFVLRLLELVPEGERASVLAEAAKNVESSTYTVSLVLGILEKSTIPTEAPRALLTGGELAPVIQLWSATLAEKFRRGDFELSKWPTSWPWLFHVLSTWSVWDQTAARNAYREITLEDDDFVAFLSALAGPSSIRGPLWQHARRFVPSDLAHLVEPNEISARCDGIRHSARFATLSERQKQIVETFADPTYMQ